MKSRASIMGHPLHPIFVTIPIGLWSFALVCDLIYHFNWGDASWKQAAFYCLGGGLVGAVPAIMTGWLDYTKITDEDAARVAKFHLCLNFLLFPFFLVSFGLRYFESSPDYSVLPVFLSAFATILLGVSGWLGGELVSKYGIGVTMDERTA